MVCLALKQALAATRPGRTPSVLDHLQTRIERATRGTAHVSESLARQIVGPLVSCIRVTACLGVQYFNKQE